MSIEDLLQAILGSKAGREGEKSKAPPIRWPVCWAEFWEVIRGPLT
ncbi:MAG: hypothetical protein ACUVR4_06480 [Anaerolineae bacterium]